MLTQIINAKILTPQGWLKDGSVLMRDNKILEVTNCDLAVIGAELIDAKGMYVVPGGVEIHVHGGGGGDFMEGTEEAFRTAVNAHMKHGTTSIFPTLSSSTVPMIEAAAETCTKLMAEPDSPILGLHLEGHYLNMKMAGGQMPENIKDPDPKEYIPIVEKWGCIKRWDAAPELPGAMQFGKYITGKGILASVAHTQAEYEDIRAAWESGYSHATHFYNAMPGFHKRREYKYEGDKPAIVDFYATWCGPCKALAPVLEELAKEYAGKVYIYKIDVDKEEELAGAFGIRSIPTLLWIPQSGKPTVTQGALPKPELKKMIDDTLLNSK